MKTIKELAYQHDICIAYSSEVRKGSTEEDYDRVVRNLLRNKEAKAVVLFVNGVYGHGIVAAAQRAGAVNNFIWLASDSVSPSGDMVGIEDTGAGGFFMQLFATGSPSFPDYFQGLSPSASTNPWLVELWEQQFGCSAFHAVEASVSNSSCVWPKNMAEFPGYSPYSKTSLFNDTVLTFAYAIDNMLSAECPEAFQDKSLLYGCVHRGDILLKYLKKVTFRGLTGIVQFDEQGDADGKYKISQLQKIGNRYIVKTVGFWHKSSMSLDLTDDIYWNVVHEDGAAPESLCSKPCSVGEYYVQLELKCCWECRLCRDNEIVVRNNTKCKECEELYWPDLNRTVCLPIGPTYLKWDEALPLLCLILSLIGLLACLFVSAMYGKHWNERLIKATSRELSLMALMGSILSYITVIFIMDRPSTTTCYFGRLGFNLSFTLSYAPLLAKTSRIYRIFAAARKGTKSPSFISSRFQVMLSIGMIFIQVMCDIFLQISFRRSVDITFLIWDRFI